MPWFAQSRVQYGPICPDGDGRLHTQCQSAYGSLAMVLATSARRDTDRVGAFTLLLVARIGTLCGIVIVSLDTTTLADNVFHNHHHHHQQLATSTGARATTTRVSGATALFPDGRRTPRSVVQFSIPIVLGSVVRGRCGSNHHNNDCGPSTTPRSLFRVAFVRTTIGTIVGTVFCDD